MVARWSFVLVVMKSTLKKTQICQNIEDDDNVDDTRRDLLCHVFPADGTHSSKLYLMFTRFFDLEECNSRQNKNQRLGSMRIEAKGAKGRRTQVGVLHHS